MFLVEGLTHVVNINADHFASRLLKKPFADCEELAGPLFERISQAVNEVTRLKFGCEIGGRKITYKTRLVDDNDVEISKSVLFDD